MPRSKEQIRGGLASGRRASSFPAAALRKGAKVELEHVVRRGKRPTFKDRELAREIAMDHLVEDVRYYDFLEKAERKMKKRNSGATHIFECGNKFVKARMVKGQRAAKGHRVIELLDTCGRFSAGSIIDAPKGKLEVIPKSLRNPGCRPISNKKRLATSNGRKKLPSGWGLRGPYPNDGKGKTEHSFRRGAVITISYGKNGAYNGQLRFPGGGWLLGASGRTRAEALAQTKGLFTSATSNPGCRAISNPKKKAAKKKAAVRIPAKMTGKLGGPGYLGRTDEARRSILRACMRQFGYRSCIGSLVAMEVWGKRRLSASQKTKLRRDRAWLTKTFGKSASIRNCPPPSRNACAACMKRMNDMAAASPQRN